MTILEIFSVVLLFKVNWFVLAGTTPLAIFHRVGCIFNSNVWVTCGKQIKPLTYFELLFDIILSHVRKRSLLTATSM